MGLIVIHCRITVIAVVWGLREQENCLFFPALSFGLRMDHPLTRKVLAMPRPQNARPRRSRRKTFVLQKANGQLVPRVQQVGPEHFGIVAIDCAKARSRYFLADFYGRTLLEPTTLPHSRGDFQAAIDRLRQAALQHDLKDVVIAIERTGEYHRPVQLAFRQAGYETRLVHPFTSKQYRQPADPGNKTDDTDLAALFRAATPPPRPAALAVFSVAGPPPPPPSPPPATPRRPRRCVKPAWPACNRSRPRPSSAAAARRCTRSWPGPNRRRPTTTTPSTCAASSARSTTTASPKPSKFSSWNAAWPLSSSVRPTCSCSPFPASTSSPSPTWPASWDPSPCTSTPTPSPDAPPACPRATKAIRSITPTDRSAGAATAGCAPPRGRRPTTSSRPTISSRPAPNAGRAPAKTRAGSASRSPRSSAASPSQ